MSIMTLRDLYRRLPPNGEVRHHLRNFNLRMMGGEALPSVRELASRLGFDVRMVKMRKDQRGRLVRDTFSGNGYRIEVNEADDVRTRRWTVLHEIMHAYLHARDDPFAMPQYRAAGQVHFYDDTELREEREANLAVEALIFGDGALAGAMGLFGRDEEKLARHFGVSVATLKIALHKV